MKKNLLRSMVVGVAALLGVAAVGVAPVAANAATSEFPCTLTAAPKDSEYMYYGSSAVIHYTAEEAAQEGLPEGYSGSVVKVVPVGTENSAGALLDFSEQKIPVRLVDSLEFRFYIQSHASNTGNRPQLRITRPFDVGNSWIYQPGSTPSQSGVWTTETVQNVLKNEEKIFNLIADENGYLNKFELSIRSNVSLPFYVDSVAVNMLENDGVAPVITYNGEESISVSMGAELSLDATAFDEQEQCAVPVEYVWEEGVALGDTGVPTQVGEYTLTLRAKDYYGNVSQKTIVVTVIEPDLEAPVIHLAVEEMHVQVGTMPILNIAVTDNHKVSTVLKSWSEGALDEYGRLTEGTHTYTVSAMDTSGNVTQKTLTVCVTVEEPAYDNVVDEEALTNCTVSFDGVLQEKTYKIGETIEKPADPVKETDEFVYTFIGWYNGEQEWDFENDVIEGNLELVSKWEKTPVESGDNTDDNSSDAVGGDSISSGTSSGSQSETDGGAGCAATVGCMPLLAAALGAVVVAIKKKEE